MPVQFVRPDVTDLVLRVFDRPLHPELLERHALLQLRSGPVELQVQLCTAGHAIVWKRGAKVIVEAITDKNLEISPRHCILDHKVRGCRTRSLALGGGVRYGVGCQLETVQPELFLQLHDELRQDCAAADLAHEFPLPNRFSPGAVSVIKTDLSRTSAIVHTYHTFPEHCAIVKTQTLLEWD